MHQVDYELGLVQSEEWDSADGMGAAKAALVICNGGCLTKHPFNKSKRNACKGKCSAVYAAKIAYIEKQKAAQAAADTAYQSTLAQDVGAVTTKEISQPKASCPQGTRAYGDGSACKDSSGRTCALWGNEGKVRCTNFIPKNLPSSPLAAAPTDATTRLAAAPQDEQSGLSMGAKIGIGAGVLVILFMGYKLIKK